MTMIAIDHMFWVHRVFIAGWVMAAALLAAASAQADSTQSRIQCKISSGGPPDLVIQVCNNVIQFGHEASSRFAEAYVVRGRAFHAKGEYEQAIADYSEALKNEPGNVLAMQGRGDACFAKKDYDRAIADYSAAIWLTPNNFRLYQDRAQAYEMKAQYDRAIADYSEVIRMQPRLAATYIDRCHVRLISNRELPQALADCNEALRLVPSDIAARDYRGLAHLRLGHYDKAIVDYDAVLKASSIRATALYGRGVAKRKQGDNVGSQEDMTAARLIRPDIVDEFIRLGVK
jgi:tetratricopeptide (TPR) repeat protein